MDGLSAAASIIAVVQLTGTVLSYLKAVYDAGKDCESYFQEAPGLCGLLTTLQIHILGGRNAEPWFDAVRTLEHGPLDQYKAVLKQFATKVSPGEGRRERLAQRLTWAFVKDDIKDLLAKTERLKSLVQIALQMDHFKLSQAIQGAIEDVKEDTGAIRATGEKLTTDLAAVKNDARKQTDLALAIQHDTSQISAFRAEASLSKDTQKKIEMLNWLSKHEYSEQQHDYIRRYKDGTGVWILDHPNFKAWQAGMRDTLFCPGNPGTGKTILSAMVVRHLIQTMRSPDVAVVFLYCKYDQRQQQSAEQLIASLARQLVAMAAKVPDSVDEAFEKRDESRFISPTMQEMLLAAIKCFSRIYLVVDALDEGDELSIKELISTIRSLHKSGVKLLATSRFLPEIEAQFAEDPWVEIRALDSDIEKYATSRLTELPRCVQNSTDLRAEVVQAIVTSTKGMFLLAKLNIDSLRDKRNVKAVKATLQKLPSGSGAYDPAYDLAMDRIAGQSPGDHALAQKVLTWVVYAMRPLSAVDLETALAVELGELELDPDNITSVVDLLSLCAGLVIVEEQARVVRLVHYTTQEYLSRNPGHLLNNPHRALSDVCVSYLGLDDFMAGGWTDPAEDLVKQRYSHVEQYPFLSYAAAHWEDHVERASPLDESKGAEQTMSLNLRLFSHDELMESYFRAKGKWETINWSEGSYDWFDFEHKTGLQYAAGRRMCKSVSALIELGFNPNRAAHETTPLIEAVRGLHVPVVKLLLQSNVNVNMQGSVTHGTTALIEAAKKLHEPILMLLLEAKANVNIQGSQWNTALTSALLVHNNIGPVGVFKDTDSTVTRARKSIVQLLLNAGSNPDHVPYRLYDKKTALMWAAKGGDEWAVTTLLNAGADPNLRDNQDMTALHFAAENGYESIVRVLLDHGGDPHLLAEYSTTVLHLAARGGNGSMVRVLLDHGCDPNLQDSWSQTALFHAAGNGHQLVVSVLLEHAYDENLQDHKSRTALSLAVKRGHESIVKTLLDHGCDPDIPDEQNTSPALWAATEGHWRILDLLLDTGEVDVDRKAEEMIRKAEGMTILTLACQSNHNLESLIQRLVAVSQHSVDIKGGPFNRTPLMYAAEARNEAVTKLLLEANANIRLTDKFGDTVLHIVAKHEDGPEQSVYAIMRLLLEANMDVNMRGRYGRTALMSVALAGRDRTTEFLLDAGADVLLHSTEGWTALTFAAYGGHENIARRLLDAGAVAYGDMAIIVAAKRGYKELLRILLDAGADANIVTSDGSTALMSAASSGHTELVKLLIDVSADVNTVNAEGGTALMCAASNRGMKAVQILLEAGANVNLLREDGKTALMLAAIQGHEGIARLLLDAGADVNLSQEGGETALMCLMYKGKKFYRTNTMKADWEKRTEKLMRMLLDAGAKANASMEDGTNALILAIQRGHNKGVQLLLDAGAVPKVSKDNEASPLVIAITNEDGSSEIDDITVKALLEAGANPNQCDMDGTTVLMKAVCYWSRASYEGIIKVLLAGGANPNVSNNKGETALLIAAAGLNYEKAIKPLLDAGADPNRVDKDGRTAPMFAAMRDHNWGEVSVSALLNAGAEPHGSDNNGGTALMFAAKAIENLNTVKALLNAGVNANQCNSNGVTPLMAAVRCTNGCEEKIKALFEAGANPNEADKKGNTALMYTAEKTFDGISVKTLLDIGADPNQSNNEGQTALMMAFLCWSAGCEEKVRALLDAGADVNMLDKSGNNALILAASQKYRMSGEAVLMLFDARVDIDKVNHDGDTALACAERVGNTMGVDLIKSRLKKRQRTGELG